MASGILTNPVLGLELLRPAGAGHRSLDHLNRRGEFDCRTGHIAAARPHPSRSRRRSDRRPAEMPDTAEGVKFNRPSAEYDWTDWCTDLDGSLGLAGRQEQAAGGSWWPSGSGRPGRVD